MILRDIVQSYGEKRILNGFSFTAEEGKITAILGESGVGKTTLLNVCAGLIPFSGSVEGVGRCSYLFQSTCLLPSLTVEGNLRLVLPKTEWEKIPAMLERVGLKGRGGEYPRKLSGGEAQRVAIARAFLFSHDTLLMDEPFSSLDLKWKEELFSLVVSLWQEKKNTVLFVTHDVREAVLLAHRAVLLKGGEVQADFSIDYPHPRDFFFHPPEEEKLIRALME